MPHITPPPFPNKAGAARGPSALLRLVLPGEGLRGLTALAALLVSRRFVVSGHSMEPALRHGDHVAVSRAREMTRGEVVVLRHPPGRGQVYIKRIVGLPGETVRLGPVGVMVDGRLLEEPRICFPELPSQFWGLEWALEDDAYFVLGDRRSDSWDSRRFGPVLRQQILGAARLRYWPPRRWGRLSHPPEAPSTAR